MTPHAHPDGETRGHAELLFHLRKEHGAVMNGDELLEAPGVSHRVPSMNFSAVRSLHAILHDGSTILGGER